MAAGTRIADHPTAKGYWLIQHVADVEGEKMVIAQATVPQTLDIRGAIKDGEAIMGEWLMAATPIPSLEPWLEKLRTTLKTNSHPVLTGLR